ncbi:hypothetical protein Droror1_Dr00019800 [Drosera rotundifolia]
MQSHQASQEMSSAPMLSQERVRPEEFAQRPTMSATTVQRSGSQAKGKGVATSSAAQRPPGRAADSLCCCCSSWVVDGDLLVEGARAVNWFVCLGVLEWLLKELKQREEKRKPFSRRRRFRDEKDIDSINDCNEHFNKKIERAFGKYTLEIKNNLERGAALPD